MKLARILCLSLAILFATVLHAQELSNLRTKKIAFTTDTIFLDTLSLAPNSLIISDAKGLLDTNSYSVNYAAAYLTFKKGFSPKEDTLTIEYRVFPLFFEKEYQHKDISKIGETDKGIINPFAYKPPNNQENIFEIEGLEKRGSISRGISVGNNQDLSVNSNLNLQLAGKVSDKVSILAAISDDNIPIQPEGNTQQLQEFDQVYIQLFDDKSRLTVGDFQLQRPNSYFMNYFKKAQGGSFTTTFPLKKTASGSISDEIISTNTFQASAAISRGKFSRNVIQGVEGNQGPYRLKGAEGESFIIVLSGTERVFIDGQPLDRGQENDYIIDYNTAEITFTAKRLITKDKRIVVEFQYTSNQYARSLFQLSDNLRTKKLDLDFNLYSEQDNKNQPLQFEFSDEERAKLALIGDSLNDAVFEAIDTVEFTDDLILYKLVDSLGYDSVFVFSVNPDSAIYKLTFSNVGQGNGNYVQDKSIANGKVFRWVAPDTVGNTVIMQGSFEPVILAITPKQRQMVSVGGEYRVTENTTINFEGALSNNDINTFSKLHTNDDVGHAFKINVVHEQPLGNKLDSLKEKRWNLVGKVGYEEVHKHFNPIERFRTVEFERDWNIQNQPLQNTQRLPSAAVGFQKEKTGSVLYNFDAFTAEGEYDAIRNGYEANIQQSGWNLVSSGSLLQSESQQQQTSFLRNRTLFSKSTKIITPGIRAEFERNEFANPTTDSLLGNSYEFLEWEAFVMNSDTAKNQYRLSYTQRDDHFVRQNNLRRATHGESFGVDFKLAQNPKNTLTGKITYRTLEILDSAITTAKPDNTLLSRLEYSIKILQGAVSATSFYEIGSGLEVKKEFSFIEVAGGQGVYTWTDYNDNNVKELDEFEIAAFQDQANYIKIFTPTNEFVKTFTNQFNQLLNIRPAAAWRGKKGIREFLTKFANQTAYRIDRKTNNESLETRFNPFLKNIEDSTLVTLNTSLRNTFFFNKAHPKFGVDVNFQDIRNKTLLVNGFDSRSNVFYGGNIRWNITRQFLLNLEGKQGEKTSLSEFFTTRNYNINYYETQPKLTWQPNTTFRAAVFYTYTEKKNTVEFGGETAFTQKVGTDIKLTQPGKGSLLLNVNYVLIDFKDPEGNVPTNNSALAFEMLEGLQPGQNATWNLSYQRTLSNNLQLSLTYNGRKSEEIKTIHAGGVQVRAFF